MEGRRAVSHPLPLRANMRQQVELQKAWPGAYNRKDGHIEADAIREKYRQGKITTLPNWFQDWTRNEKLQAERQQESDMRRVLAEWEEEDRMPMALLPGGPERASQGAVERARQVGRLGTGGTTRTATEMLDEFFRTLQGGADTESEDIENALGLDQDPIETFDVLQQ